MPGAESTQKWQGWGDVCHRSAAFLRGNQACLLHYFMSTSCVLPKVTKQVCASFPCRADAFAAPLGEVCGVVQQHAAAEERRLAGAAAQLRQQVLGLLCDGMTLMTCSLSSTVLAAVKEAAGGS